MHAYTPAERDALLSAVAEAQSASDTLARHLDALATHLPKPWQVRGGERAGLKTLTAMHGRLLSPPTAGRSQLGGPSDRDRAAADLSTAIEAAILADATPRPGAPTAPTAQTA